MQINSSRLLFIICGLFSFEAWSAIDVIPKVLKLENEIGYFSIVNNGDNTEYIEVDVKRIVNPGVGYQKEKYVNLTEDKNPTLIYSPFKLVLSPHQIKKVKFKKIVNLESEEVYRVDVKPSVNPLIKSDNTASVIVNMGFSVILKNMPNKINKRFIFICKGNKDMVINKGNVHVSAKYIKGRKINNIENVYPGKSKWFEHGYVTIENESCAVSGGK
ncbi:hypothetical protein [Providencia burhodogranariea]|uniref:Fimbrial chaperone n=1 Tax=Providencia burhodogranariea DSM 19968 TaxID=1141662 RepID=K8WPX7_9GAMM|nr:hypothetical protein OOA_08896 [Providencia burhodogranariea DSM 19968]